MIRGDRRTRFGGVAQLATLLAGCGGRGSTATSEPAGASLSVAATAGKALFFDKILSVSGQQSCGTCHVPSRTYTGDPASDQGLPVPLDGAAMDLPGLPYTPPASAAGQSPTLPLDEINVVVASLSTLTDGYNSKNPAAYGQQTQCLNAAAAGAATSGTTGP
jgi:hypothetical protein